MGVCRLPNIDDWVPHIRLIGQMSSSMYSHLPNSSLFGKPSQLTRITDSSDAFASLLTGSNLLRKPGERDLPFVVVVGASTAHQKRFS